MRKIKILIIVGALIMVAFSPIYVADIQTKQNNEKNTVTNYEYTSNDDLVITFELSELIQTEITTEQGDFTRIEIPGSGFIGEIGEPQLPIWTRLFAVPTDQISLEILDAHVLEQRKIDRIYPVQKPQPDDGIYDDLEFIYDESIYQQDISLPDQIVEITDSGNLRDIPFVRIQFYPVQYHPYQQIATIYDTITIKIKFNVDNPIFVEPEYTQKPFYNFYKNVFFNWEEFVKHTNLKPRNPINNPKDTGCDYLIITHPNFYSAIEELAQWKHSQGYMTKLVNVTDIGSSSTQIRQYIQDTYDTWTPCPSYVLLVGDSEFIPTNYQSSAGSDLWYTCVDGSDYYPDLFIGRIPADTAYQAEVIVQKILTYEQTPPTLESFYQNFVVAAYFQDDENNGYETRRFVRTSEEVRDYLNSIGYNGERIYCTGASVNPTNYNNGYYGNGEPLPPELLRPTFAWDGDANDIINAIEQGIFILNHRDHGMESGWGDPYFTTSHFSQFANGELLPVVFSLNCLTGRFDDGECFCEEFLRKDDGGAVAIFGATRTSYSGYNDYLCRGFYDAMWPEFDTDVGSDVSLYHLGEILNYGKIYMANTWGDGWGYEELTFELFHCFGDPTFDMYTALPGNLDVTYTIMSDVVQVLVQDDGSPVEGSLVCLSQESGFYKSGITDETGKVDLDVTDVIFEGELSLVASAHNYLFYTELFYLNQKPDKPSRPQGPAEGKPNTEYMYTSSTIDPDDDRIQYNFSWGDGTYSGWVGPFDSGEQGFAKHSWAEEGTFEIIVKAVDTKGKESEWSEPLVVSMPMSNEISHPLLNWLSSRVINRFPLLGTFLQKLL